jgi:hypothetical protein
LTVPAAYIYIFFILMRELCMTHFPITLYQPIQTHVPVLARFIAAMQSSSLAVEIWCAIEGIFYICCKWHIQWLQRKDTLEASLSAAPMKELDQRRVLWQRMMDCEKEEPIGFLSGWFFDEPLSSISKYDIRDFLAWSMFEGRHQEHLSTSELDQLEDFVDEMEHRISLCLHEEAEEDEVQEDILGTVSSYDSLIGTNNLSIGEWRKELGKPKKSK